MIKHMIKQKFLEFREMQWKIRLMLICKSEFKLFRPAEKPKHWSLKTQQRRTKRDSSWTYWTLPTDELVVNNNEVTRLQNKSLF